MPSLNNAIALRHNGIEALRAVYNGITFSPNLFDYPLAKEDYPSLKWVIYPDLFEKDNLQRNFLSRGDVARDSTGFSSFGGNEVVYYPPFSPKMEEISNTGEFSFLINFTPQGNPGTGLRLLFGTPFESAVTIDKVRVFFDGATLGIRHNRDENRDASGIITKTVLMANPFTDNTPYSVAVTVDSSSTKFYLGGSIIGTVANTEPNFVYNVLNVASMNLCHRGVHNNNNSFGYKNLNFCAAFDTAISGQLISDIYQNPKILIDNSNG